MSAKGSKTRQERQAEIDFLEHRQAISTEPEPSEGAMRPDTGAAIIDAAPDVLPTGAKLES